MDVEQQKVTSDLDRGVTFGVADGPDKYIEELDRVVPTFIDPREDLIPAKAHQFKRVSHHIPFDVRGDFKPEQWPDAFREKIEYRVNEDGFVLCSATTKGTGEPCQNKAVNRTRVCRFHGGALHPLDKKISPLTTIESPKDRVDALDRPQKFMQGFLEVEDLTDEEIQGMFIYNNAGQKVKSTILGAKINQKLAQELHRRMNRFLQTKTASMLNVMVDIAESELVEPADRIKAAQWVAERTLGKTPDVLIHSKIEAPYENIFDSIDAGSREDYRTQVGKAGLELGREPYEVLDAEIIEESENPDYGGSDSGRASDGESHGTGEDDGASLESARGLDQRREEISSGKDLKKARAKLKSRRFAARANGAATLKDLPWAVEWKFLSTKGCFRMKLVCPDDQTEARLAKIKDNNEIAEAKAESYRRTHVSQHSG